MSNRTDLIRIAVAVLSLVKLLLSSFGVDIPQELINTIVNILAGLVTVYGLVKHNFLGKKGKRQKKHLQDRGLL